MCNNMDKSLGNYANGKRQSQRDGGRERTVAVVGKSGAKLREAFSPDLLP